ncbi:MAG: 5-bromo-4-chloroindolyl phosphate hydrolysis family protein [Oliverpabstia sp.]|nr:5-bromo-4-chloroindolyl phosphate hydrolysis family protein [Eubacterium sp.]MDY2595403.1 5-bromo-4-chloroindolyl phosphate hydrolysis family protein [Oliverpabstia sp.]
MNDKEWQKMGKDILNVVQDAISSGNYQQLNEQVKQVVDSTVDGLRGTGKTLRSEMQNLGEDWRQSWLEAGRTSTSNFRKSQASSQRSSQRVGNVRQEKQLPAVYAKKLPGQVSGIVLSVTGFTMSAITALSGIGTGILMAISPSIAAGVVTGVMGVAAVGGLVMGMIGSGLWKTANRFRQYTKAIGNRAYCTIEELAGKCGRDKKSVVKDLKKMIDKKMFLQGHLDEQETCVIVTDEMYQQYLLVQKQAQEREIQEKASREQKEKLPEECRKILEEGNECIRYIRKCNDDIPGEEMSQKLSRLELIITRIFEEVGKNPELAGELRKFMNYYLPTTRKLVDAYRELDQETIISENMAKTKKEIEDTLDTINEAFENLLDSFFEERAMDISSDISVLQTMLAQEGLTGKDFRR